MKIKSKFMLLALALSLSAAIPVHAEEAQSEASLTPGSLSATLNQINFNSSIINLNKEVELTAAVENFFTDGRGKGDGWSASLSVTNFTSTAVQDRTNSEAGATFHVEFPGSSVKLDNWYVSRAADVGQKEDSVYGPKSASDSTIPLGFSPTRIITAAPGFGMGRYVQGANFTLSIPTVGVISNVSNPTTSKYKVGQNIGLPMGTYTSTFTYTISSGI